MSSDSTDDSGYYTKSIEYSKIPKSKKKLLGNVESSLQLNSNLQPKNVPTPQIKTDMVISFGNDTEMSSSSSSDKDVELKSLTFAVPKNTLGRLIRKKPPEGSEPEPPESRELDEAMSLFDKSKNLVAWGVSTVKTHVRVLIGAVGVYFALIVGATLLQRLLPLFSTSISASVTVVLFLAVDLVRFLVKLSKNIKVIRWILLLVLLALDLFMVYIYPVELSMFSIILTSVVIVLLYGLGALIVYFTKSRIKDLKKLSPMLDMFTIKLFVMFYILSQTITFTDKQEAFYDGSSSIDPQGLLVWPLLFAGLGLFLQFLAEWVEILEGTSGDYQSLNYIDSVLVLTSHVVSAYIIMMSILYIFKNIGLVIWAVFWIWRIPPIGIF